MHAVTGGFVGALVTGLAVFGWQSRPDAALDHMSRATAVAPSALHAVSDVQTFGPGAPQAFATPPEVAPVSVRCEPGQRAVLRKVAAPGGVAATEAACVDDALAVRAGGVIDPAAARPVRYASVERVVPERGVTRARAVRRAPAARSWQKRALVIGGSAGAGAGIGAIAGGRKGALLGAAIGGGAGTVYELLRK
jgi:hypothetical protein